MGTASTSSTWSTSAQSASDFSLLRSAAAEALHEELELLIDLRLGGFHRDEAVDEALAVGEDEAFEVGNLSVDVSDVFGEFRVFVDEGAFVTDGVLDEGVQATCDAG